MLRSLLCPGACSYNNVPVAVMAHPLSTRSSLTTATGLLPGRAAAFPLPLPLLLAVMSLLYLGVFVPPSPLPGQGCAFHPQARC